MIHQIHTPSDCCGSTKPNNKHNPNQNFNLIPTPMGLIGWGWQDNIRGTLILNLIFKKRDSNILIIEPFGINKKVIYIIIGGCS